MIIGSVTATMGKEGTVMLVLGLWVILISVFLVLKKRICSSFSQHAALTDTSLQSRTFERRFLENTYYILFFFIFLSLSLLLGLINLYFHTPFISFLSMLFIFCSLMIFVIYLSVVLLFIWKTWWSH